MSAASAREPAADRVTVCHTAGEATPHAISVPAHAAREHVARHADFHPDAVNGCCTDDDCGENGRCEVEVVELDDGEVRIGFCAGRAAACEDPTPEHCWQQRGPGAYVGFYCCDPDQCLCSGYANAQCGPADLVLTCTLPF